MAGGSKAWRCLVCGYVHYGDEPPEQCPVCGAARSDFEAYTEPAATDAAPETQEWRCLICLYIHKGPAPPEQCPVCGAPASRFEPVSEPQDAAANKVAEHIVVLGSGIAGISAVEAVRKASTAASITLISKEKDLPYYRLNLTRLLAGEIDESDLPIHPADWYTNETVELLLGSEAVEIRPADKTVVLHNGKAIQYDKLILTAGAHAFVPPIPGSQREGVRTVRSWQDARWIIAHLAPGLRCVCIGGGVLGVETAGALAKRGAKVTLLEGFGWLMPRQLNETAGLRLAGHINKLGVELVTAVTVKEIVGDERVGGVLLEDGRMMPADLVVITTGIRTNSFLARQAGLTVGTGVVVDDHLCTSDRHIFAAGDVAEHRGIVYGIWPPAQYMGTIAGSNAAGATLEFAGIPRSNTLKVLGVDMLSIGIFEPTDGSFVVIEEDDETDYSRFVFHDKRLVGAILLGETSIAAHVSKAVNEQLDMAGLLARKPTAKDVIKHLRE